MINYDDFLKVASEAGPKCKLETNYWPTVNTYICKSQPYINNDEIYIDNDK